MKAIARISTVILIMFSGACGYDRDVVPATISIEYDQKTTYFADGSTMVPLSISIPKDADNTFRSVKLHTKAGVFDNGDTLTVIDMRASTTKTVQLHLGTVPKTYSVTAEVGTDSPYKISTSITLNKLSQAQVIKEVITTGDEQVVADGESEIMISVSLGIKTSLRFKTEKGLLRQFGGTSAQEITVLPDAGNKATAILKMGREAGSYNIWIETDDKSYNSIITFQVGLAYAEQIILEVPQTNIDSAGQTIGVKATLVRSLGKVSKNVPVTFTSDIGLFSRASFKMEDDETFETQFIYEGAQLKPGDKIMLTATTPGTPNGISSVRNLTVVKK